jgi:hypothetical protein
MLQSIDQCGLATLSQFETFTLDDAEVELGSRHKTKMAIADAFAGYRPSRKIKYTFRMTVTRTSAQAPQNLSLELIYFEIATSLRRNVVF